MVAVNVVDRAETSPPGTEVVKIDGIATGYTYGTKLSSVVAVNCTVYAGGTISTVTWSGQTITFTGPITAGTASVVIYGRL